MIIGDSLALPGHLNKYENTWIYLLKKNFPKYDFITYLRRALTTDVLITNGGGLDGIDDLPWGADCLESFMPDIVILQIGIVDCAPRLFKQTGIEKYFIKLLPKPFKNYYINIIKKYKKRSSSQSYTSSENFKVYLKNYFNRCKNIRLNKLIVIGIPYPNSKMISKNQNIINSIKTYNNIYDKLSSMFNFIKAIYPLDSRRKNYEIFQDGYHPNTLGHNEIFQELKKIFNGFKDN